MITSVEQTQLAPFYCLPVVLWNSDRLPRKALAIVEFLISQFKSQPIAIYSTNAYAINKRPRQMNQWLNYFRNVGYTTKDLKNIRFVNLVIPCQSLKDKIDFFYIEYMRNSKYFRGHGFTHFMWFQENSNLKQTHKILQKSKELYLQRNKAMFVKQTSDKEEFPLEASIYTYCYQFLDDAMLSTNTLKDHNYLI